MNLAEDQDEMRVAQFSIDAIFATKQTPIHMLVTKRKALEEKNRHQ